MGRVLYLNEKSKDDMIHDLEMEVDSLNTEIKSLDKFREFVESDPLIKKMYVEWETKRKAEIVHLNPLPRTKMGEVKKTPNNMVDEREVEPIRNLTDLQRCIDHLKDIIKYASREDTKRAAMRNYFLFTVGINVGFRVSDLVELQWKHIFRPDMRTFVDTIKKEEKKTGKKKIICPNDAMKTAVINYLQLSGITPKSDDYLFVSGRKDSNGNYGHITDAAVEKMIKEVTSFCNLEGNYNTHSLRKTYAYQLYMKHVNAGDPLAIITVQRALNHESPATTARYLGITREQLVRDSQDLSRFMNLDLGINFYAE